MRYEVKPASAGFFFFLFIFLKQFYIFPSGGIGAADICLLFSFLLVLRESGKKQEWNLSIWEDRWFYLFLLFVVIINTFYGFSIGKSEFFKYTLFWLFNAGAIWTFRQLAYWNGQEFFRWLNRVIKINIVVQLGIYVFGNGRIFHEYWGAVRYQGTFNDPNQLAVFMLMMFFLVYLYHCRWGDKTFLIFYLLTLPVIVASKSTGVLLGMFVFTGMAVLYELYRLGRRYRIPKKLWMTGATCGLLLFIVTLWWIWPSADFDVKTMDYTMLARVQEKLWKASHGGLAELFLDRGMDKLLIYPRYLLYGAGEGGFERFTLAAQCNEIHCCFFSILFCYGIVPTVCLMVWLLGKLRCMNMAMMCAAVGLLTESFFLVNYRQPMFWMILLYGSVMMSAEHGKEVKG